jgi:erythritol transport system permease protein
MAQTFPNLEGNPAFGTTGFAFLGEGKIVYLPVAIWVLTVLALIAAYVARWTPLGRYIFMVGGNERPAALSGIHVNQVKFPRLHCDLRRARGRCSYRDW